MAPSNFPQQTKTKTTKTMNSQLTLNSTSGRMSRFSRNSRALRSDSPLTDEQIERACPSIFARGAHGSRSQRYAYIPTSEVLTGLRREGFLPFYAIQGGARDAEKKAFTKHMLRLRHATTIEQGRQGEANEIVLVNSHDGSSSYQLMGGRFRSICTNGMISGSFDTVRIKHSGDVTAAVIEGANEVLQRLPEVSEQVREWSGLRLTEGEQGAFAAAALALRYESAEEAPFTADKLLTLHRREDQAPTAWNTLNVIQENVIAGGIGYTIRDPQTGRAKQQRRTRGIEGIEQNVHINRGLWVLAQEMAKLKSAA